MAIEVGDYIRINKRFGRVQTYYYQGFSGPKTVNIRYLDDLIPEEETFIEDDIEKFKVLRDDVYCPKCGNSWTRSVFNMHEWFDCRQCNKRKEDLLK